MDERRRLTGLAYRLLGSMAEAEDAVQEAYARWYALSTPQRAGVESPAAWLTTVTSRICLDVLRSARARRERYVGEWLPEPLPGWPAGEPGEAADPADRVSLDESVTMAFLVVLESMTPAERVAFVLHDVFRFPFAEVGEIVGRAPGAARQLASSARRRVSAARPRPVSAGMHGDVVRRFQRAWQAKDIAALLELLDPDATAIADSGGRALAFLDPIVGRENVARAWIEVGRRMTPAMTLRESTVNGQPGLVVRDGGVTVTVFAFDVSDGRITRIWAMRNPDKLRTWVPG